MAAPYVSSLRRWAFPRIRPARLVTAFADGSPLRRPNARSRSKGAIAELDRARAQAYASIAPALQDRMRPWLPRVTNGRYLDVSVEPNDLTMQVTEAGGQKRQADRLSHGTTEQIYLLLRVALSEVLSGGAETAPLILDDVTTQSDSDRTVAVMELLHELSKEHQVILFTQEDDVVAWAEQHCDPERDALIALPAPGV